MFEIFLKIYFETFRKVSPRKILATPMPPSIHYSSFWSKISEKLNSFHAATSVKRFVSSKRFFDEIRLQRKAIPARRFPSHPVKRTCPRKKASRVRQNTCEQDVAHRWRRALTTTRPCHQVHLNIACGCFGSFLFFF